MSRGGVAMLLAMPAACGGVRPGRPPTPAQVNWTPVAAALDERATRSAEQRR
jgi:hypothetical protein